MATLATPLYMTTIPVSAPATDPYYGLLIDPKGYYGLTSYGNTHAVTLTGSPLFQERGYNLFTSFGGETAGENELESRVPPLHNSIRPDTVWFCMPKARVLMAIQLYFYTKLWTAKGECQDVRDEEGDFIETVCSNEDALMAEASELAAQFVALEMTPDSAALPKSDIGNRYVPREHGVVAGWGANDSNE